MPDLVDHRSDQKTTNTTGGIGPWASATAEALKCYGIPPERMHTKLISLSENATWVCIDQATGERRVLRLHRPGFRSHDEITSELAWSSALRKEGAVSTPAFAKTLTGESVAHFKLNGERYSQDAVLFNFAEGQEPDSSDLDAVMVRLGEQTARLHLQATSWQKPDWFVRPIWDVDSVIGSRSHWGTWRNTPEVHDLHAEALFNRVESHIRSELREYGRGPERFGLIHGDLRTTNLLIQGDEMNVIDFDDCGFGWYLYDLACSLSFVEHDQRCQGWVANWLKGYEAVRRLSVEDRQIIPTLIMLRRMLLVAWVEIRRETQLAQQIRSSYVEQTVPLAEKYLAGTLLSNVI